MQPPPHRFTNKLANETSPYLLQHAHNPVKWFPWGEEALSMAVQQNKPILVSIGYAACHWCHVMERESFEDEQVAAFMNEHFVNIKIDREERPDIDHIYMDAVQAMTGSGGWPLNVFLTPGKKPFYGGTYFPPSANRRNGRASWLQVLEGVSRAFTERREEIEKQGDSLTSHIRQKADGRNAVASAHELLIDRAFLDEAYKNLEQTFDKQEGGFGGAPKFPGTFCINFLLRYANLGSAESHMAQGIAAGDSAGAGEDSTVSRTAQSTTAGDTAGAPPHPHAVSPAARPIATRDTVLSEEALHHAYLTLNKMCMGGIYDQLGGGFARYSTDAEWLAPHFEKMLYDNALLVSTLSDAYKLTHSELYADTIRQTLAFVQRELMNDEGGFYASLDADSEGVEGKFYVWQKSEIDELLKQDAELFCAWYDVSEVGNWEGKNILRVRVAIDDFAKQQNKPVDEVKKILANARGVLWQAREKRIRPALDDKIILSWNALMCSAYANAYAALGDEEFLRVAEKNMGFLLRAFERGSEQIAARLQTEPNSGGSVANRANPEPEMWHNYKNGQGYNYALLDDYSLLIQALLDLYEVNFDTKLITKADELTQYVLAHFYDETDGLFFYTGDLQTDLLFRKKEIYDGAVPSGNSIMAKNLKLMGLIYYKNSYTSISTRMTDYIANLAKKWPFSFANWLCLLKNRISNPPEIAILGDNFSSFAREVNKWFIPNKIMMVSTENDEKWPLLAGKGEKDKTLIYVCENYSCKAPVNSIQDFLKLMTFK